MQEKIRKKFVFPTRNYPYRYLELIIKQQEIKEKLESITIDEASYFEEFQKFLELLKSVYLSYKIGNVEEKREMVQIVFSNFTVKEKTPVFGHMLLSVTTKSSR
jgi:rubrerythrin